MKTALIVLMLTFGLLTACADDPAAPPPTEPPPQTFQPLTSRNAVLNNLELAWTQRHTDKIDELLDADFVFYFDDSDVGGEIPESWDRTTEMATSDALFTSNTVPSPSVPVCLRVIVDLANYEVDWVEAPVPASAVGEVWYSATLNYTFIFEMEGDLTFIRNDAKAQFVVRQVDDTWRLVEWRDLGGTIVTSNSSEICQTCAYTWGRIKALYR